ncbi:MAG TPA: bifunctional phosphoribosylaminoimidazolecarboxamide formyltransferase/IMP cyclohydrolase [Termitinemataceae bacterium]|nr:bifunctional phosphoribosylaminoimidazolecarboxamide formyltransferase/IMP cyclohydrolase [Termitinemataceae bacterium]HOM23701.1 bifunctional phosphoribosylaminoimidazolecarboxamide formyltransferase/IMP cyclohydrolase [Termitinemataceae bacterium]HPP99442.1 bifunctional phosphoribosylaminoimidazolecarboxamide formyltransferase/IMP cyclohydrolase [Termitinemataceae bacterium]
MKRRALISVFYKEGIIDLARFLHEQDWEILSTGGTARYLKENGLPITDVSQVTGFPECLDGRVKTLHPAIHGGLLARRSEKEHMETIQRLGIQPIDLVCVNLYPFFEKVQAGLSLEETVEFIDIGGPTMLRSAAKNFQDVLVLTDPADYPALMEHLRQKEVPLAFRKYLAGKVFNLTSAYDAAISRYLLEDEAPRYWPMSLEKKQELRYGENAHQRGSLYLATDRKGAFHGMEQLQGKELSYNNIRDMDLAWKAACAFGVPALGHPPFGAADEALAYGGAGAATFMQNRGDCVCVAVKHNTPCGIGLGKTLLEAYEKAFLCDPVSIFGGIVACTTQVDGATAARLAELFLEIVIAPDFSPEALEIFKAKKNLRLIRATLPPQDREEVISVDGGLLVQSRDNRLLEKWEVVTERPIPSEDIPDLLFGMRAVTFVKSNAIVVVKEGAAVGIGGGQTNRIWAAQQALERGAQAVAADAEGKLLGRSLFATSEKPRVLASDAFFPFADVVEAAAAAGIRSIIQPGGSIRDKESIEAANRLGIAMVFTGTRHFKH